MHRRILSAMALAVAALFACPALAEPAWTFVPPDGMELVADGVRYQVHDGHKIYSLASDLASNSFRFECRAGEVSPQDIAAGNLGKDRAELTSDRKLQEGKLYAYAFQLRTDGAAGGNVTTHQTVVGQLHASTVPGVKTYPQLSFEFSNLFGARILTTSLAPGSTQIKAITHWQGWGWQNGRVYSFVVQFAVDHGEGKGRLKIIRDGVVLVDDHDFPFGYSGAVMGPYMKMGCYRLTPAIAPSRLIVRYYNVKGPTEADLSDRIANPPALP